uniref:Neuronal acetylcholine receptor subunit beta-3-like n=1 Tax=Saccoglossus kowalevskii TaxID=10224 RepID=A0ABM0MST6_SACKO|nr:PREDICTED: neuronal acetylcholine receptor subunit beta-3-like [Saccoglossus kowalevskii]
MTLTVAIMIGVLLLNYMHYTHIGLPTILGDFLLFSLVLTVLVIGETALVYAIYYGVCEVPSWVRKLFVDWLARFVCVKVDSIRQDDVEMKQPTTNGDEKKPSELENRLVSNNDWVIVANVIDRICFWVFVLTYSIGAAVLLTRK